MGRTSVPASNARCSISTSACTSGLTTGQLNGSNDADSRKGVPFLALVDIVVHLWDQIAQKP